MAADGPPPPVTGFRAAGLASGIKRRGVLDLALIVSDRPAVVAGAFTTNRARAAPVLLDLKRVRRGQARGVLINSGCANACTGPEGLQDAVRSSRLVSRALGVEDESLLVASTGVIGKRLPVDRIARALPRLVRALSSRGFAQAARAIMTTDTFPKLSYRIVRIGRAAVTALGFAKGAGMLEPHMKPVHATMLGFLVCDVAVEPKPWRSLVGRAVESTFNRVTVDGETSTNDTFLALANGASGARAGPGGGGLRALETAVTEVCGDLARLIAKDGEGSTKLVEVNIEGARSRSEARVAAYRVARSPLVKTAVYGEDANWGRVVAALGAAEIRFDPARIDLYMGPAAVVRNGKWTGLGSEARATAHLRGEEVRLRVHLHAGRARAQVLTCDLTEGYIRENASYRG